MPQKTASQKRKQSTQNPYETLKNTGSANMLDQIMGSYREDEMDEMEQYLAERKQKPKTKQREEFSLFRYQEYHEGKIVKEEIAQLSSQIRKEMQDLKSATSSLSRETEDVERVILNPLPENPGVYHIRFLEILLQLVRTIRLKIGESKTWLEAMVSKKQKRGSAFLSRSKSKGTQYSLSQELQTSRSVQ